MESCLGFNIPCDVFWKGALVAIMGLTLFIGSVYVMLSAVFGRWMGYLVLMVGLSGWMIIQSSLWLFGFWSQGLETPTNLGPRGAEPSWVAVESGIAPESSEYPEAQEYPLAPWEAPTGGQDASVQSVNGAIQVYLAETANEELGKEEGEIGAVATSDFTVQDVRFATAADDKTSLAAAQGFYNGGGPLVTVVLRHDSGSVPRYSYMFLVGSILLFLIHVPLLDRAEKKRKEMLTGGEAPPWYGPA